MPLLVPPLLIIMIFPFCIPSGAVQVILLSDQDDISDATIFPNFTVPPSWKLFPDIVIMSSADIELGLTNPIIGVGEITLITSSLKKYSLASDNLHPIKNSCSPIGASFGISNSKLAEFPPLKTSKSLNQSSI